LLRTGQDRPRSRRAAKEREDIAADHSMTSSARRSMLAGTEMPSAFAVLRLITNSNLVAAGAMLETG
jgi:hypothetical protein